jgi:hypothetical protein
MLERDDLHSRCMLKVGENISDRVLRLQKYEDLTVPTYRGHCRRTYC